MKFFIVLASLAAATFADKRCHGVYIDNRYYNLEIIKEGINNIHDLAVNTNDDSIYFTYDDFNVTIVRRLAHFNPNTRKATLIHGINNATAIAVDQFYGKVYVGGSDGLYKINELKPERLPINDDIISMHYNGLLYFINRKKQAFQFEDGFATPVEELKGAKVDSLIINDDDNIIFTDNKNLYRIKRNTRLLDTHEKHVVNAIATDSYSRAFICTKEGLYMYNKYKFVFDKIANLKNLKTIAFYKTNDLIYVVNDLLVKLSLSSIGCFED